MLIDENKILKDINFFSIYSLTSPSNWSCIMNHFIVNITAPPGLPPHQKVISTWDAKWDDLPFPGQPFKLFLLLQIFHHLFKMADPVSLDAPRPEIRMLRRIRNPGNVGGPVALRSRVGELLARVVLDLEVGLWRSVFHQPTKFETVYVSILHFTR